MWGYAGIYRDVGTCVGLEVWKFNVSGLGFQA